jgi:hypothetical protein
MKKARPTTGSATKQSNAPKRRIIESDQCDLACPVPLSKKFRFSLDPNQIYIHRRPVPQRGAFRDRHGREAGCGGRW